MSQTPSKSHKKLYLCIVGFLSFVSSLLIFLRFSQKLSEPVIILVLFLQAESRDSHVTL